MLEIFLGGRYVCIGRLETGGRRYNAFEGVRFVVGFIFLRLVQGVDEFLWWSMVKDIYFKRLDHGV